MKTLTPAQVKKEIDRRNRIFKNASAAGKRVLLAKDVLRQIAAKMLRARRSHFVKFGDGAFDSGNVSHADSLQEALLTKTIPSCQVCALGGLVVSCTLFRNKVKVGAEFHDIGDAILDRKAVPGGLHKFFDREQLMSIEQAFEHGRGFFKHGGFTSMPDSWKPNSAAITFGKRFAGASQRLKAIMENIIRNKGTFKP